jgi:hypothetical protein
MKAADEAGIPLPLAERLRTIVPNDATIDGAIGILRNAIAEEEIEGLSEMDLKILRHATMF